MKNHQNRIKKYVKSSKYQLKTVSKAFKTAHLCTHIHGNKGIEHQKGNETGSKQPKRKEKDQNDAKIVQKSPKIMKNGLKIVIIQKNRHLGTSPDLLLSETCFGH